MLRIFKLRWYFHKLFNSKESLISKCLWIAENIPSGVLDDYNPLKVGIKRIMASTKNLEDLVSFTAYALAVLKENITIERALIPRVSESVLVDYYLAVGKDGSYVEPKEHFKHFRTKTILLCTMLKEIEHEETGIEAYNVRMLQNHVRESIDLFELILNNA